MVGFGLTSGSYSLILRFRFSMMARASISGTRKDSCSEANLMRKSIVQSMLGVI